MHSGAAGARVRDCTGTRCRGTASFSFEMGGGGGGYLRCGLVCWRGLRRFLAGCGASCRLGLLVFPMLAWWKTSRYKGRCWARICDMFFSRFVSERKETGVCGVLAALENAQLFFWGGQEGRWRIPRTEVLHRARSNRFIWKRLRFRMWRSVSS